MPKMARNNIPSLCAVYYDLYGSNTHAQLYINELNMHFNMSNLNPTSACHLPNKNLSEHLLRPLQIFLTSLLIKN